MFGDNSLMQFAFYFLRQTMFGEETIKMNTGSFENTSPASANAVRGESSE